MLRSTTPAAAVYSKGGSSRSNRRSGALTSRLRASRTPLLAAAAAVAALVTAAAVVAVCVTTLSSLGLVGPTNSDQQWQHQQNASSSAESRRANATDADDEPEWQQSRVTHLVATSTTLADDVTTRFRPSSFLRESSILNQTVHCDEASNADLNIFYKAPTWMCKNIKVGERRLPFCDATLRTSNELVLLRRMDLDGDKLFREMCGHLPDRRNNEFLLCELLLAELAAGALAAPPVASSVHIPSGNCSLPERRRIIMAGSAASGFNWHIEARPRPGFVTDLLCSFAVQQP